MRQFGGFPQVSSDVSLAPLLGREQLRQLRHLLRDVFSVQVKIAFAVLTKIRTNVFLNKLG